MARALPIVIAAVELAPARTIFTRFIPPESSEHAFGQWRKFYRAWEAATRNRLAPGELELVTELQKFVPPAMQFDKPCYSAFFASQLHKLLQEKNVTTLIVSGAETDVCVLATVLDAVDFGYRVLVLEDALCSSSDEGHDALMSMYRKRFSTQIEVIDYPQLADLWKMEQ
jgi:nicotinamidase-related amidase